MTDIKKAYNEFKEADYLQAGSQKSYFGAGYVAGMQTKFLDNEEKLKVATEVTEKEALQIVISLYQELKIEKEGLEIELRSVKSQLKVFENAREAALQELSETGQYE